MLDTVENSDRKALAAAQNVKERDFWLEQLSGYFEKMNFPYDYGIINTTTGVNGNEAGTVLKTYRTRFDEELAAAVLRLSGGTAVKLHMILVAALVLLMNKYYPGRSNDIAIGSPILKQKIEGDFINKVLVFRVPVNEEMSFKELLLQARERIILANKNQNYPLEFLTEACNLESIPGLNPFFDVALLLEDLHDKRYLDGISYNILFSFARAGQTVEFTIDYDPALYLEGTLERISYQYMYLLKQALEGIDTPLRQLEVLSQQEKQQLLVEFNQANNPVPYPQDQTLHGLFEQQVERSPANVVLVAPLLEQVKQHTIPPKRYTFTYKKLNEIAENLAHELRSQGTGPGDIVPVMVHPSIEMMAQLLGVLKTGAAYLPMDPYWPQDRIDYILNEAAARPPYKKDWPTDDTDVHRSCRGEPRVRPVNNSLAYVIYTSGSTGKPKGVMVEHGNVVAYVHSFFQEFDINEKDTVIQTASYAFDVFVEEVYPVLYRGGKSFIPYASEKMDMGLFARCIQEQQVSIIDCTPLFLNEINKPGIYERLNSLRIIISGGDELKPGHIDNLLKLPHAQVYNTYGPTESTVCATYYRCIPGETTAHSGKIPIGKPISNYQVYILDKENNPVPLGVNGELCVAGPGLARGYLNNPELTATRFIKPQINADGRRLEDEDAIKPHVVGRCSGIFSATKSQITSLPAPSHHITLYKTGDLCRWLDDGNIEFLGRIDKQVKIRGFRIELGEIENRLLEHKSVKEAVVMDRTGDNGDLFLCAYIVEYKNRGGVSQNLLSDLKEHLSQTLPYYMVPAHIVFIDEIPLNTNGKVDYRKLPAPLEVSGKAYVAPQTEIEKKLATIYAGLLNKDIETIGIDDSFFELGGNSLKLIQLTTKIREAFKFEITFAHLFENSTIKKLAAGIQRIVPLKYFGWFLLRWLNVNFINDCVSKPRRVAFNVIVIFRNHHLVLFVCLNSI